MVTPAAKREAVAHLQSESEVSERRACTVLEGDRTSVRYRSCEQTTTRSAFACAP
jgi:putative transposase